MTQLSVLFWSTVLFSLAAMSADARGVKDQLDAQLTSEVETLVEQSVLREFAGLEPVPNPSTPVSGVGPAFVEIPLIVEDGHLPLVDLAALYGVYGPPVAAPCAGCAAGRPGGRRAGDDRGRVEQPAAGCQVAVPEILIGAAALVAAAPAGVGDGAVRAAAVPPQAAGRGRSMNDPRATCCSGNGIVWRSDCPGGSTMRVDVSPARRRRSDPASRGGRITPEDPYVRPRTRRHAATYSDRVPWTPTRRRLAHTHRPHQRAPCLPRPG